MFEGATAKLQDARTALYRLRGLARPAVETNIQIISGATARQIDPVGTDDPVAFSEAFSSCVAHIRSVGDAVLKDKRAQQVSGFQEWRELRILECRSDELLKFVNDQRNSDLHEGLSCLTFAMQTWRFSSDDIRGAPSPGAILFLDSTGPYWLVEQGTPRERRVACANPKGYLLSVAVARPPTTHKGRPFTSRDPVSLCEIAESYYAELLFEAKTRFAKR